MGAVCHHNAVGCTAVGGELLLKFHLLRAVSAPFAAAYNFQHGIFFQLAVNRPGGSNGLADGLAAQKCEITHKETPLKFFFILTMAIAGYNG